MAGNPADAERILRKRILDGSYAPGEKIPSVAQIAEEFDLTPSTANTVVGRLRADGLIVTKHGSGSYVRAPETLRHEFPGAFGGQFDMVEPSDNDVTDLRTDRSAATINQVPAPATVAAALGLNEGDPVIQRYFGETLKGRFVMIAAAYYDPKLVMSTSIMFANTDPFQVHAVLGDIGRRPVGVTETFNARMPFPQETAVLELAPGTPVLDVVREAFDEQHECVEVVRMILDGSAYVIDAHSPGIDPSMSAIRARARVLSRGTFVEPLPESDVANLSVVQIAFPHGVHGNYNQDWTDHEPGASRSEPKRRGPSR
ncbi:hypothetical protein GCM10027447_01820 [Glycomyces halotolerans]